MKIERLKIDGYLTLIETELHLTPLTLLLGRNGSGKTAILSAMDRLSRIAWGGPEEAFGPPPFSLGFLRTRGHGDIDATRFEIDVRTTERYRYKVAEVRRGTRTTP